MARSKAYLFGGVEIRWSCDPSLVSGKDEVTDCRVVVVDRTGAGVVVDHQRVGGAQVDGEVLRPLDQGIVVGGDRELLCLAGAA